MKKKYFISSIEVFPLNAGEETYQLTRKKEEVFFENTIETEFAFRYESGGFNFKTQESINISEELDFKIQKECNGVFSDYYTGVFSVSEGRFDDDKCLFFIKVRTKEFVLEDVEVNIYTNAETIFDGSNFGVFTGSGGGTRNYINAFRFDSVILTVASNTNLNVQGIISDFFQINPINVSADCLPGVPNYFKDMAFCALSDVQEPIPTNLAKIEFVTFRELMEDLNVLFDVFWFIENNNLRIEHRLFFDGSFGLDLTQTKYDKYFRGTAKYSYDLKDYPKSEVWKIIDSDQFGKITYNQVGSINKNQNQITNQTKKIRTDYAKIRYYSGGTTEEGLFLFATELSSGAYRMFELEGQNFRLSPSFLVTNIHTYERPYLYGIFESFDLYDNDEFYRSGGYTAKSTKKTKRYEDFKIPFCCGDELNPSDKINTKYGIGVIDRATIQKETLTIGLKFENENDFVLIPNSILGLRLWLDSSIGVIYDPITFKISQWSDQSGNSLHATQALSPLQPVYDPVNQKILLDYPTILITPAFQMFPLKRGTVFVLFETYGQVAGAQMNFLSTNDGTAGIDWDFSFDGGNLLNMNVPYYYPPNDSIQIKNGLYSINRISDTTQSYRHNSKAPFISTVYNPGSIPNTQISSRPLFIGYNPNLSLPTPIFQSKIIEVIIYDRSLTDFEIQGIEYYLAKKGNYKIYP